MIWRPAASAALLAALATAELAATGLGAEHRNWRRFRAFEVPATHAGDLVRIEVAPEVYAHARSDLGDLRILDREGNALGYAVYSRRGAPGRRWRDTRLSEQGFVPGSYSQVVVDTGDEPREHNALDVTIAGDDEFFARVEIAASSDGERWRIVRQRAPLFRFPGAGVGSAPSLGYPRTRDRWLRLRFLESGQPLIVERVEVTELVDEEVELAVAATLSPAGGVAGLESRWSNVEPLVGIPVRAVGFASAAPELYRPVEVSVSDDGSRFRLHARGHAFRFAGDEPAGESLLVHFSETTAPHWRVAVLDRGDPPLVDLEVRLLHNPRYLVFRPPAAGVYRLAYDNPRAAVPDYELGRLVGRDRQAAAASLLPGAEETNAAWMSGEPFTERHPALLWLVLLLVVAVLAALALRALR